MIKEGRHSILRSLFSMTIEVTEDVFDLHLLIYLEQTREPKNELTQHDFVIQ